MKRTAIAESRADDGGRIAEPVRVQRSRPLNFIRRRAPDRRDAEDIVQDVFLRAVAAYRPMKPIEHAGARLFRVARNRITSFLRKRRRTFDAGRYSAIAGRRPEAAFARTVFPGDVDAALNELPEEQRDMLTAHEMKTAASKKSPRKAVSA